MSKKSEPLVRLKKQCPDSSTGKVHRFNATSTKKNGGKADRNTLISGTSQVRHLKGFSLPNSPFRNLENIEDSFNSLDEQPQSPVTVQKSNSKI